MIVKFQSFVNEGNNLSGSLFGLLDLFSSGQFRQIEQEKYSYFGSQYKQTLIDYKNIMKIPKISEHNITTYLYNLERLILSFDRYYFYVIKNGSSYEKKLYPKLKNDFEILKQFSTFDSIKLSNETNKTRKDNFIRVRDKIETNMIKHGILKTPTQVKQDIPKRYDKVTVNGTFQGYRFIDATGSIIGYNPKQGVYLILFDRINNLRIKTTYYDVWTSKHMGKGNNLIWVSQKGFTPLGNNKWLIKSEQKQDFKNKNKNKSVEPKEKEEKYDIDDKRQEKKWFTEKRTRKRNIPPPLPRNIDSESETD